MLLKPQNPFNNPGFLVKFWRVPTKKLWVPLVHSLLLFVQNAESQTCLYKLQVSLQSVIFYNWNLIDILHNLCGYLTLKYSTSSLQLILEPFISLIFRLSSSNNNGTSTWSWSLKSGSISTIKYTVHVENDRSCIGKKTTAVYTIPLNFQLTSGLCCKNLT